MRGDHSGYRQQRGNDHRPYGGNYYGGRGRSQSNNVSRENNKNHQRGENGYGRGRSSDNRNYGQHGGHGYGGSQKKIYRDRHYADQWNHNNRNRRDGREWRPPEIVIPDENTMKNLSDKIPHKNSATTAWNKTGTSGNDEVFLLDKGPVPVPACLKIEEEIKDLTKLNQNSWDQECWTWEDKICSQMEDLPKGMGLQYLKDNLFPTYCLKEDTEEYFQKKISAAEAALKEMCKKMSQSEATVKRETQSFSRDIESEDEDFDSDDAMNMVPYSDMVKVNNGSIVEFNYDIELLKAWSKALPYNLLFLVGFEVQGLHPSDEVNCHCPCGPKMTKWRLQFGLEGKCADHDQCTRFKKFEPPGLMAHLAEQYSGGKGGYIHGLIELYIRILYADNNNGHGHKALHKAGDPQYKLAVAAERNNNIRARKKLEHELEEHRHALIESRERERKLEEEKRKFKQLNKDQYDKIVRLQKDLEFLKISPKTAAKETSEIDLKTFKDIFDAYINSVKSMHLDSKKDAEIKLEVPSQFSLQDMFVLWNETKDKDDTYLFRDLDFKGRNTNNGRGIHNWRIFLKWNVIFRHNIETSKKLAKKITAVDDGGPTREFISQVCKQMGSLSVPVNMENNEFSKCLKHLKIGTKVHIYAPVNGIEERQVGVITKSRMHNREVIYEVEGKDFKIDHATNDDVEVKEVYIQLFEENDGGFVPVTDEKLESEINILTDSDMMKQEILVSIKKFYRAIGRIMCHCITSFDRNNKSNYPIASQSLPLFFRNVILRGVRPGDEAYSDGDVISHLNDIGVSNFKTYVGASYESIFVDNDKEIITKENICTKLIPKMMLDSRKISIEAMTEGLTLNGMVNIQSFLKPFPLDVVSKLIFGIPVMTADDVINILIPEYNPKPCDDGDESLQVQKNFFENTIPLVLRDMDELEKADKAAYRKLVSERKTFIMRFVKFCTGFDFLPDPVMNPNFKITVNFSFTETHPDYYPMSHSCVNELKIPGDAYQNDIDTFKSKLDEACQYTKDVGFNMQ